MNENVVQTNLFSPSKAEMVFIENKLIDVLNVVVKTFGLKLDQERDIEAYLWKISEKPDFGFPSIEKDTLGEIIKRISGRAISCGFPQSDIPKKEVRVTMMEVIERTNITPNRITSAESVLIVIGDFMESCGDPRGEKFIELAYTINEMIVESIEQAER